MKRTIATFLALASAASAGAADPDPKPYQVTVNAPWYERAAWREYQAARHAGQAEATGRRPATSTPALQYDATTNSHTPVTSAKSLFDQKLAARQQQVASK